MNIRYVVWNFDGYTAFGSFREISNYQGPLKINIYIRRFKIYKKIISSYKDGEIQIKIFNIIKYIYNFGGSGIIEKCVEIFILIYFAENIINNSIR